MKNVSRPLVAWVLGCRGKVLGTIQILTRAAALITPSQPAVPMHKPHAQASRLAATFPFTNHAMERGRDRCLSDSAIDAALTYGRMVHQRGADIYAIGRRDLGVCLNRRLDLGAYEGTHVVCTRQGVILTVYRDRRLRGLRNRDNRRARTPAYRILSTKCVPFL